MEHVLRSCLIALRLADRLGLDEAGRAETYWVTLLATVCTGESFELAQAFGDDIAFRSGMYHVGPSQLAVMFYVLGRAGTDRPAPARMRVAAGLAASGGQGGREHVPGALRADTQDRAAPGPGSGGRGGPLVHVLRWDGKGVPRGAVPSDVPMSVRIMQLADAAEVHHRLGGVEGALAVAQRHAGKLFAPERRAGAARRRAPRSWRAWRTRPGTG